MAGTFLCCGWSRTCVTLESLRQPGAHPSPLRTRWGRGDRCSGQQWRSHSSVHGSRLTPPVQLRVPAPHAWGVREVPWVHPQLCTCLGLQSVLVHSALPAACPQPLWARPGPIFRLVTSARLLLCLLHPAAVSAQPSCTTPGHSRGQRAAPTPCHSGYSPCLHPVPSPLPAPSAHHGAHIEGSWVMDAPVASGPVWRWEVAPWLWGAHLGTRGV